MEREIDIIQKYFRAANYLTAVQIYLQDNVLLDKKLTSNDIKPRLLGHWGTCPGINFVYAHLNNFIIKHKQSVLFVLGTGHGFPALQANLYLEKTLSHYYPDATHTSEGISYIAQQFSWPYGFPSHSNPEAPGVIVEGGELGYSLSTAYGAILDNPDLIAACLIGDGEAETGPTATAWHLNKFIDPVQNGTVLPILHLNGYKISGPTIFGRMSNEELIMLFTGYGYKPILVESADYDDPEDMHHKMIQALERSYQIIKETKEAFKQDTLHGQPHMPMIILKTPKGWTGPKHLHDEKIEGNNLAHQVIGANAKTDKLELTTVESWLRSYNFFELFNTESGFHNDIMSLVPEEHYRMGSNKHAFSGKVYTPLTLPSVEQFSEDASIPGTIGSSNMKRAGLFLNEVFKLNAKNKNFRLMSPDETYSNKLDAVFQTTSRAFVWPTEPWDKDITSDGRVMEMLSEHSLQGLAQGYVLSGRHAVFATYEAFVQVISSMVDQYLKFLKVARTVKWRGNVSSLTYILTSSGWRQDHNGFSHQNPGFISEILEKQDPEIKIYFPVDGNSTLAVLHKSLSSTNGINVIVAGKTQEPRWLTPELAIRQLEQGVMVWDFASDADPDIVLCGIGDYVSKEALACIDLLKKETNVKVRFVNVVDLTGLQSDIFDTCFTKDKPILINFHGYPETVKKLLFDRSDTERFSIHGYRENGSTTTPFDMHVRNQTSRYHLFIEACTILMTQKVLEASQAEKLIEKYTQKLVEHTQYIKEYGIDPEEIENWQWKRNTLS